MEKSLKDKSFKSGFIAIIGKPNVGKSALLNRLLGKKISIVSSKPQTTRNKILGVRSQSGCQMIFLDTPGIHSRQSKFNRYMTRVAFTSLQEVDIILWVVEYTEKLDETDLHILQKLSGIDTPLFFVVNKIDLLQGKDVSPVAELYREHCPSLRVIPVSALTGENVDGLLSAIIRRLPAGPMYFPDDMMTDRHESFVIAEFIRERVIHHTKQEIPYSVAVIVEDLETTGSLMRIKAVIYVEKDSQKGIVIGKEGKMLKKIGQEAREGIERLFGNKSYLELWVKVRKDWRKDDKSLKEFGYS